MANLSIRLRASALTMRTLYAVSLRPSGLALIDRVQAGRIARELEEAAQALDAGPWMPIETAPKDKALLTHDGVSYNLAHFNTALGKWIANHPYDERLPREPIRWTLLPPHPRSGTAAQVAQEGAPGVATRTVPVELLQRAIDALGKTNARDVWCDLRDAAGVATDQPNREDGNG